MNTNYVINADVKQLLPLLKEKFHLTFTSPPYYNAREYSQYSSYEDYLDEMEYIFQLIHEHTLEGRFLIVNSSPVIEKREKRSMKSKRYPIPFDLNQRITKNGWEFIDDIIWVKPEASVKNRAGGFHQHRKPLGYKPNLVTEYLMVYRKETDKLIDWNMRQYDNDTIEQSKVKGRYETNNVWKISPVASPDHPAVFPLELAKKVIQYYSYKGDTIFDPFAGTGTTGMAAKELGRGYIMVEKDECYYNIMRNKQNNIFSDTKYLSIQDFMP